MNKRLRPGARRRTWAGLGLLAVTVVAGLVACATPANQHYDERKAHHRPDGFRNPDTDLENRFGALVRWKAQQWRDGLPTAARQPTPVVAPDLNFIHTNARAGGAMQPAATWIGHSTVLMQMGGLNLLTDPIFSSRASPVSWGIGPPRAQAPGLSLTQLPRIDAVVISHNHYDHLDEASVLALNAQAGGAPLFLVPLGLKRWFTDLGITRVIELDWWQHHTLAGAAGQVEVHCTPVQHWSARSLRDGRMQTLWAGWAVLAPDFHFYFAGDTGYSGDFKRTREHFRPRQGEQGFDFSAIPIGAYEPRWFMRQQHVNPEEALFIHRDVASRRSLGVHWGTFLLADEPLDRPPQELAEMRTRHGVPESEFFVMAVGETRVMPRRP